MKKLLYIVVLSFTVSGLQAQTSGYLGKKNHFQLTVSAAPSFKHQNSVSDLTATERLKIANMSYHAAYSRVFSSNFEISVGYQFASMNCISDDVRVTGDSSSMPLAILQDPKMIYHGGYVSFNFYRRGSLAPLGKFYGFHFAYGNSTMIAGEEVVIGSRGTFSTNSFFKREGAINEMETLQLPKQTVNSVHLKLRVGRTYPISDYLMIYGGMTFPLLSYYNAGNWSKFGWSINAERDITEESDWSNYSMATVRFYNLISVEGGLRMHF